MFEVTARGNNRLDIEIDGRIDSAGMKEALDALLAQSQFIEGGRMLYRIEEFDLPTLGAIAVELKRLPQLFKLIRRFDRIAVVTDRKWVQTASEIEGALLPGVEIKAFDTDSSADAEAWLSG